MNKAVLATLCFAAGACFGFVVGYSINKKASNDNEYVEPIYVESKPKEEPKPEAEKTQGEIFELKPAKIATKPGETGINYSAYVKDLKYKQETQSPPEDEPESEGEESDIPEDEEIDMTKYEETYEERLERESNEMAAEQERYRKEHEGKIEFMSEDDWNTDYPETDYEREDIYYFTESDILTDEDGHALNENETIGPKVRQVGWMQSPDENVFIRNHIQEKEYRVFKEHCTVEDWF